jgi:hypothetical protein
MHNESRGMFSEKINKKELAVVAKDFKRLLGRYSADYPAAKNVLDRTVLLIDKAINGEIDSPYNKGFFPEEFWESGPLFEVDDLSEKCAQFSLLLKGAISFGFPSLRSGAGYFQR